MFVAGMLPPMLSTPAPIPPCVPIVSEAAGICSWPYSRPLSPQEMIPLVSGLYELDGQSMFSNGVTCHEVVSYGVKSHAKSSGLPSGVVSGSSQ